MTRKHLEHLGFGFNLVHASQNSKGFGSLLLARNLNQPLPLALTHGLPDIPPTRWHSAILVALRTPSVAMVSLASCFLFQSSPSPVPFKSQGS